MCLAGSFRKQSRCLHQWIFSTTSTATASTSIGFASITSTPSATTDRCVSGSFHFAKKRNNTPIEMTINTHVVYVTVEEFPYVFLFRTTFMLGAYTRFGVALGFGIRTEFRLPPRVRSRGNLNELNLSVLINGSWLAPCLTTVDDDGVPL